ncbi:MAG: hypothetical protein A3K19_09030 [Lentisphaerae bacterium RIFOXYB12_FULL_65_16]|nr:MAG: hypothetical protein A3K18_11950 [Lentisphaerae bacterium RIFOXYA12_64_32]OGV90836.1 MAG: hypothetical protein A3K19_09030 [Lentisphaerae bacterium RIFOXYB12_FULL_65_16]
MFWLSAIVVARWGVCHENEAPPVPGGRADIEEKLGTQLPAGMMFTDTDGTPRRLETLLARPTVLVLVYYCCTAECSTVLDNLATTLRDLPQKPGRDYNVVVVSFDITETPEVARRKKDSIMQVLGATFPSDAVQFLVGNQENIDALTAATGFHTISLDGQFIHSTALIILAPGGRIVRYVHGSQYLPSELSVAVSEAATNKTGVSVRRMLSYCFSTDPAGRHRALNLLRLGGVGVTVGLLILVAFLLRPRRKPQPKDGGG